MDVLPWHKSVINALCAHTAAITEGSHWLCEQSRIALASDNLSLKCIGLAATDSCSHSFSRFLPLQFTLWQNAHLNGYHVYSCTYIRTHKCIYMGHIYGGLGCFGGIKNSIRMGSLGIVILVMPRT